MNKAQVQYAKETAMCVDLAYGSIEADIRAELERPDGPSPDALQKLLEKLRARRAVLVEFTEAA
jgi:hypothetical protein